MLLSKNLGKRLGNAYCSLARRPEMRTLKQSEEKVGAWAKPLKYTQRDQGRATQISVRGATPQSQEKEVTLPTHLQTPCRPEEDRSCRRTLPRRRVQPGPIGCHTQKGGCPGHLAPPAGRPCRCPHHKENQVDFSSRHPPLPGPTAGLGRKGPRSQFP